jgi:glycerol-3-phosphate acyltransferase PlsY
MQLMTAGLLGLAYVLGSGSSAIIVCKIAQLPDPRHQGSGNPGATNVLRYGGKKWAALTLFGDVLKGIVPVLLAKAFQQSEAVLAACALLAFLGHLYPVFFQFQGGKGVATGFGALLALVWPAALSMLLIWLVMARAFRYSSLAALTATLAAPLLIFLFQPVPVYIGVSGVIALLLFWRHRRNIHNLITGKEDKIGAK